VRHGALLLLIGWAALGFTLAVLPGVSAQAGWEVLLAAVLLGLLAAVLRPAFAAVAVLLGWAGVIAGWLLSQAVLMYLALSVTPGIQVGRFWDAFEASWFYAIVVTIASWLVTARPDHHQSERCRDDERDLPAAEPGLTILGGAVGLCLTRRGRPSRPRPVPRCHPRRPLPDRGRELSGLPRVVHRPFIRRG
jgi:uncharacterized membrane protein YvlD (DUF360 family)